MLHNLIFPIENLWLTITIGGWLVLWLVAELMEDDCD